MPTSAPLTSDLKVHPDITGTCNVCPHPWNEHDALGVRYCTATTALALARGCICQ